MRWSRRANWGRAEVVMALGTRDARWWVTASRREFVLPCGGEGGDGGSDISGLRGVVL